MEHLVPRILELASRKTPWHRQNWRAGTLEVVREFVEEALIPGTKEQALKGLRDYAFEALKRDEGAAPFESSLKQHFQKFLKPPQAGDYDVQLAKHYCDAFESRYLQEWADLLSDPERSGQASAEGTAKRIVSHALYLGMPASTIYSFFEGLEEDDHETDIGDAIRLLDERLKRPKADYTFAVPLNAAPGFLQSDPPESWLNASDLKQWKHRHARGIGKKRHHGGFILKVSGRDINEAVRTAQDELVLLEFKFWVGSRNRFDFVGQMWCKETGKEFPVRSSTKGEELRLRAFERAESLHELNLSPRTRNVLALIEPLRMDNAHIAVVNGWTVIESLLVEALGQDSKGAERMALLIAASYFRTELVWLASNYGQAYSDDGLEGVHEETTSLERAEWMAEIIAKGEPTDKLSKPDQLAIEKMSRALKQPKQQFERTVEIIQTELLRLYRKRNLIVHGGKAVDFGIEDIADKIVPLIVHGVDQILIGEMQLGMEPIELAAHVRFKADQLPAQGASGDYSLLRLLEV